MQINIADVIRNSTRQDDCVLARPFHPKDFVHTRVDSRIENKAGFYWPLNSTTAKLADVRAAFATVLNDIRMVDWYSLEL